MCILVSVCHGQGHYLLGESLRCPQQNSTLVPLAKMDKKKTALYSAQSSLCPCACCEFFASRLHDHFSLGLLEQPDFFELELESALR